MTFKSEFCRRFRGRSFHLFAHRAGPLSTFSAPWLLLNPLCDPSQSFRKSQRRYKLLRCADLLTGLLIFDLAIG